MDALTVLITGAGAPGIKGTLYSLENNFDRRVIRTIGTDINQDAVGKYLCSKFYRISKPAAPEYLSELLEICREECVAVVLPQNTAELYVLAEHKKDFERIGTRVAVSPRESIEIANDKGKLMKIAARMGVPVADHYLVNNFEDLIRGAVKLGWPGQPVVVKPPDSHGMRGFRIIDETLDLKESFYSEKPAGVYLKMDNLRSILGDSFSPLMVMEYLPGEEYTVDLLAAGAITAVPRRRDAIKSGITFTGTVQKITDIIDFSIKMSRGTGLEYAHGFQFKRDKNGVPRLLESNPRVQGTMVLSAFAGANIIYGAVKQVLGEAVPEFEIKWGTRIFRYWGGDRCCW